MKNFYMWIKLFFSLLFSLFLPIGYLYADCTIPNGTGVENIEYVHKWASANILADTSSWRDCNSNDTFWSICTPWDRCKYSSFMWTDGKFCQQTTQIKSSECEITSCDEWYILSWDSCIEDTSGWSCVYSYSSSCSQWYSYNSSTNKCELINVASPCQSGFTYNSSTWKCEDSWTWKGFCEESWFKATWDNLNCEKRIVSDPFYIGGDIYNNWILACGTWTSYNVISKKCEWFITNNESPKCNMYIDSFYDSDNWTTIRNTQFQWNKTGSNNKCVWKKIKNYSCTSWFILNSSTKQCEKKEQQNPSCSIGNLITSWPNEWKCELESNCWVDSVNWGWSDYSYGWWSICDTSTGTKTRQWTRTCTNPTPFWGWSDCIWANQNTESTTCSVNASCWASVNTCNTWTFSDRTDSNWMAVWSCVGLNSWENKICQYNTDNTAPTGTVSYSPSSWTNQNVTISVSCSDSGSWCDQPTYSKTVTLNGAWNITIRDKVWNTRNISYNVTNIDNTPPSWEVSYTQNSSTWNVVITVECSDSGSWCKQSTYTKSVSSNGTGIISIADNAWNSSNVSYNVVNIDNIAPTGKVSYSPSNWTNWNVVITVECSDSGSWCNQSTYTKSVSSNGSGIITISDNAWNTKNISYNVTNIDKVAPTATISHNQGWYNNIQTITFSAKDTGWSRLKRIYLQESVNGWNYTYVSAANYDNLNSSTNVTKTFTRSAINGNNYKYRLISWDYTGQYSIVYGPNSAIYFDTVAPDEPNINSSTHQNNVWLNNNNPSFWISKNNVGPSNSTNYYCIDTNNSCDPNISWDYKSYTNLSNGVWYFRAKTCDTGWCSGVKSFTIKTDMTKATWSLDYNTGWYNKQQIISFWATDTGWSKLKRIRLQVSKDGNSFEYIANTDYNNLNTDSIYKEYIQIPNTNIIDNTQWDVVETPLDNYEATPIDQQPGIDIPSSWNPDSTISNPTIPDNQIQPNDPSENAIMFQSQNIAYQVNMDEKTWELNNYQYLFYLPTSLTSLNNSGYKYRLIVWDNAGNITFVPGPSGTINFDTIKPTVWATNSDENLWKNTKETVTLSAGDQWWSGVKYSKYIWNNNSCVTNWVLYSNGDTTTIPAEWKNTLYLCASDNAGNIQTWSGIYKFDETNPEVNHNYLFDDTWTNASSVINFKATDPNPTIHSDIKETKYCRNSECNPNISGNSITLTLDDESIYRFQTIDHAGNKSPIKEVSVKIEDNTPNISVDFTDTIGQNYTAWNWINSNINAKINCRDTDESINSGCNPDTYQFNLTDNKDTCLSNVSWFENYTSQWVNITTLNNTNKVLYICMRAKDFAENGYSYSDVYEVKIDKIIPNYEDISVNSWYPDTNSKLHASERELSYSIDDKSWAPIVKIEWYFEDYENNDSFTLSKTSSWNTLTFMWNMTKVDNEESISDGMRTYSFHITKIEDQAGNSISRNITNPIKTYNYNVYANIDSNLKISLVKNDLNSHNIANGEINNMNIEVRDEFNNIIIPIANIWRKVNMVFSGQNTLKLNQYNTINSDSSIFVNIPNSETLFKNDIFNSWDNQYNNLLSNNWIYTFEYKVYTPTFNGIKTNGQQYVNGWAHISEIEVKTQQDLGINNVSETEFVWNKIEPNIDFDFAPLISTQFDWDFSKNYSLNQDLENIISFINTDSSKPLSNQKVFLWFGKATQNTNGTQENLNLVVNWSSISEWHQTNITNLKSFDNFNQKSFSSEIKQTKESLTDNEKKHYISTHIWYTLDGNNIFYNSDIIWKTNYSAGTLLDSSTNLWVKVLWNVQSKNQTDISDNQSETDIYQLWNNTKADLKEKIKKNVAEISMNVSAEEVSQITNIWWNSWDNSIIAPKLSNQKILLTKWEVKLSSAQKYTGKKTLVIQWWNLYITENLLASNKVNDILWIIVLEDENGNGWNVYIDPSVTALEAVIFADKSLLNYDGSNVVTDGRQLKNQFYFYWTLFSENTLWGYVSQQCPYFVSNCDFDTAEKYDLNFLRSYYVYDSNDDGNLDAANWNSYFNSWDAYFAYPVIFEYNSNIQNNPPDLFEINQ